MARTIKELAKENTPPMGWYHFQDEAKECFSEGFEAGANAVLSEIESILDSPIDYVVASGWQGNLTDVIGVIRQRIKELKGE